MKEKEVEEERREKEQEKEVRMDEDVIYEGELKMVEKEQENIVGEEKQEITTGGERNTGLDGPQVATKDCRTKYQEVIKAQRNPYP